VTSWSARPGAGGGQVVSGVPRPAGQGWAVRRTRRCSPVRGPYAGADLGPVIVPGGGHRGAASRSAKSCSVRGEVPGFGGGVRRHRWRPCPARSAMVREVPGRSGRGRCGRSACLARGGSVVWGRCGRPAARRRAAGRVRSGARRGVSTRGSRSPASRSRSWCSWRRVRSDRAPGTGSVRPGAGWSPALWQVCGAASSALRSCARGRPLWRGGRPVRWPGGSTWRPWSAAGSGRGPGGPVSAGHRPDLVCAGPSTGHRRLQFRSAGGGVGDAAESGGGSPRGGGARETYGHRWSRSWSVTWLLVSPGPAGSGRWCSLPAVPVRALLASLRSGDVTSGALAGLVGRPTIGGE
jgi:hypothetical protein